MVDGNQRSKRGEYARSLELLSQLQKNTLQLIRMAEKMLIIG